ncbi:MAG TPA: molybdate ABC transporter substrate-binding protein [Candidatus Polarisedimenticolia bacterium]|nr:molybdate ABC transporter substrate-binding protein [Candidatus Polarisedimenticolia bacterium]
MLTIQLLARAALALAALSPAPASPGPPPEIIVYAAASLRDALSEMAPACEGASGVRLVFNFGASNDLARQIMAANKADVFLSADGGWMDKVAAEALVDTASRRALLSNRLVVVGPVDSTYTIASASDLARAPVRLISIANPEAVPAGKYAKAWLERQGQWDSIRPRALPGVDVRAALAAVEAGAAQMGIVYATDAAISKKVRVLYTVPEEDGPLIRYPIAVMKDSHHLEMARAVVSWMSGPEAGKVFTRFGFILLDGR